MFTLPTLASDILTVINLIPTATRQLIDVIIPDGYVLKINFIPRLHYSTTKSQGRGAIIITGRKLLNVLISKVIIAWLLYIANDSPAEKTFKSFRIRTSPVFLFFLSQHTLPCCCCCWWCWVIPRHCTF